MIFSKIYFFGSILVALEICGLIVELWIFFRSNVEMCQTKRKYFDSKPGRRLVLKFRNNRILLGDKKENPPKSEDLLLE